MSSADPHARAASPTGSYYLGRFFGIELRLHWSFLLLVGWIAFATLQQTGSIVAAATSLLTISSLFLCVVLHEYGHALTARHFGIGTREVTLLPIGGVALLESMPSRARDELWIALAGPAVNMVLAAVCAFLLLQGDNGLSEAAEPELLGGSLLAFLFRVNVVMGVFNLLPALPMDGGRVLRALLAMRMPQLRATRIASRVASFFAAAFFLLGLTGGNLILCFIAVFVWLASRAEYGRVAQEQALRRASNEGFGPRIRWVRRPVSPHPGGLDPPGEWVQSEVELYPPGAAPRHIGIRKPPFDEGPS
jgi:Zn-dependent protease